MTSLKRLFILFVLTLLINSNFVFGKYSGGDGTSDNPWRISSKADLLVLGDNVEDYNDYFVMTNDINMAGDVYTTAIIAKNASSDDFKGTSFKGLFEGNGHKIINLTINGERNYIGVFGVIDSIGFVRNLGIENLIVSSSSSIYVGGLVGKNAGSICNCFVKGSIYGSEFIGGLAGGNYGGIISNCYSSGSVSNSTYRVGGLVGDNGGNIINCYSTSIINGTYCVGGLVGNNSGNIVNCYSTGAITGSNYIGGFVGYNSYGCIRNCYSTGIVSGHNFIGGLCGDNDYGNIIGCFWNKETSGQTISDGGTGLTILQMKTLSTFTSAGWDFMNETTNGTCNFWMISQDGYPVLSIFNGVIPSELVGDGTSKNPYIVTNANDLGMIWYRPSAHYKLINDINLAGIIWSGSIVPVFSGTFDGNGFCIKNFSLTGGGYLGLFGRIELDGSVKNLGIENCSISSPFNFIGGLVGYNLGGNISNSFVTGLINGNCEVGGLVGNNFYGRISDSNFTGVVTGECDIGGLVGVDYKGEILDCNNNSNVYGDWCVGGLAGSTGCDNISNCYTTGSIDGNSVGGLVGSNLGTLLNCYSNSSVDGTENVGGIAGYCSGSISNCYATSNISGKNNVGGLLGKLEGGTISNCFWNIEMQTHNVINSIGYNYGGTSFNTAALNKSQMQKKSTYKNWDFINIWFIRENQTYPNLRHFIVPHKYSGGDGTANNPWRISNKTDILALGNYTEDYNDYFVMTNDINMAGDVYTTAIIAKDTENDYFENFQGTPFRGLFDGNDFKIIGLTINGSGDSDRDYLGLFGMVYGEIRNLGIEQASIKGNMNIGSLMGSGNGCSISKCYSNADVSGNNYVGGLIGNLWDSDISNCYSHADVSGSYCVGGLAGSLGFLNVLNCYSEGSVNGEDSVGGWVGEIGGSQICESFSSCNVNGNASVGGLIGVSDGANIIINTYASGNVIGNYDVGGLAGKSYNIWDTIGYTPTIFLNSYSTGYVEGHCTVGGLIGLCTTQDMGGGGIIILCTQISEFQHSCISNCYSKGNIKGDSVEVGGLVGMNCGYEISNCYSTGDVNGGFGLVGDSVGNTVSNCFWSIETQTHGVTKSIGNSDLETITNVLALTTAQMQQKSTYTTSPSNWDFINTWAIVENQTYPYFRTYSACDFNQDNKVDYKDFAVFSSTWLHNSNANCDLNQDYKINYKDLAILAENWLSEM